MTICAALIVKNESAIIGRCLESILKYIDYWVIADTGSTDNTKQIIREKLSDIPGELHDHDWQNFGENRTKLIKLCKGKADYILLLDAEMVLNVVDENFKEKLNADAYYVQYAGDLDYSQELLVSGKLNWEYKGVTHEYKYSEESDKRERLENVSIIHFCDGKRRPSKFKEDVELLTKGLDSDPKNERYMFYLAQSYFDMGEY